MNHLAALAGTLIWVGVNFFTWSWNQEQAVLFWQSLGMGGTMMSAMFWYVNATTK
jgi:hypothetical protein